VTRFCKPENFSFLFPFFLFSKIINKNICFVIVCIDFNECGNRTDNCSALAMCVNTVGSYNCTCNSGYSGNGFVCDGN
jgi:hypothetical protein